MKVQYGSKTYRIPSILLRQTHKSVSYDELVVKQFKLLTKRNINEDPERFGIVLSHREHIRIVTNDKSAIVEYYQTLPELRSYRPIFDTGKYRKEIFFELLHNSHKSLMQKTAFVREYFCNILGHHNGEGLISLDNRIVMRKTCFFPVRVKINEKKWCLGYIKASPEQESYTFPFTRFIVDVNKYKEFELYDF